MADPEVTKRLDTIISILQLAYSDEIERARERIRAVGASSAILDATATEFVAAGELKRKAAKAFGDSERTVSRRIGELVALGALEKRPTGQPAYRATGLI
jgi:predicted nucleic acid-binding protein